MDSELYDEYLLYIAELSTEELEFETECAFVQINDEDECIKYDACVKEAHKRGSYGK